MADHRREGALELRAERSFVARRLQLPAQQFIHTEQISSLVLLAAAILALVWANSPWRGYYFGLWDAVITVDLGFLVLTEDLQHWVNDALMAVFFFVVGLEIKRELVHGELSDPRSAALPATAALGGMICPALIYYGLNAGTPGAHGWGIPMATDIAFALGMLAVLGRRVPASLRVLLLSLAIVDDIGAILVIAVFYSKGIAFGPLLLSAVLIGLVYLMRRAGFHEFGPYVLAGVLVWTAIFESGIHATIAGVVLGLMTPAGSRYAREEFAAAARGLIDQFEEARAGGEYGRVEALLGQFEELSSGTEAPLDRLVRNLHPWTSFVVLPIFALANAGVEISAESIRAAAASRISLGIAAGLIVGKVVGVTAFAWLATRLGLAVLPARVRWGHLLGLGLLAGVGFTVSLFITGLAFADAARVAEAKLAILAASVVAGLLGVAFLSLVGPGRSPAVED